MKDLYIAYNPKTNQMSEPFHPFSETHIEFSVSIKDSIKICDALTKGLKMFQAIGVEDRMGEPIFEGALVSDNFGTPNEVIRVVEFKKGSFVARVVKGKPWMEDDINVAILATNGYEIVGHMTTDAELLK